MVANGNSFGLNGSSACSGNGGIRDPESAEHLGFPLMWNWTGFQKTGNAL